MWTTLKVIQSICCKIYVQSTVVKTYVSLLTLVALLILCPVSGQAQTPTIQWQKSLGGSSVDGANSIQPTTDGGSIVAGYSSSNDSDVTRNQGGNDYWIVKLDAPGNITWQKSLGGSSTDFANDVQQTTDGGYIVAGSSESNDSDVTGNHGDADYWIVKLDASGNMEWQKSLGGSSFDHAYSIDQTTDGGYIVAGVSASANGDVSGNHGLGDYWIVKLDSSGNLIWQKSLGGGQNDYAFSIQQTANGGFIVAGYSSSHNGDVTGHHLLNDYWIVMLDPSGNIEWEKSLGGTKAEAAYSVQQTTDGGFIVAGYSSSVDGDVSGNHGGADYWIVKLDSSGNLIWQKSLGGSIDDAANSIEQTSDGGFIVAGYSSSNDGDVSGNHANVVGTTSYDYWIVRLDTSGNIVWQESLGGSSNDLAYSVHQTTGEGFIVAGLSDSNDGDVSGNNGSTDYWVVNLVSNVTPACFVPTGLTTEEITATSVKVTWDSVPGAAGYQVRYKIAGSGEWNIVAARKASKRLNNLAPNTNYAWGVKTYCTLVPFVSSRWSEKERFTTASLKTAVASNALFDVYPNPFNSSSVISFSLADDSKVLIQLADVTGRKVQTVLDEFLTGGNHELTLNRYHLNEGIYFLQIKLNEVVMTKKIVIIE